MLYGIKCWAIKKQNIHKMSLAKMRMLRWISINTRSEEICLKIRVAPIDEKIKKRHSWDSLVIFRKEWVMH